MENNTSNGCKCDDLGTLETDALAMRALRDTKPPGELATVLRAAGLYEWASLADELIADANRYAKARAMVCETDKVKQARMLAAMEQFEATHDMFGEDSCTPEQFDAFTDAFLSSLQGARDADR